MSLASSDQSEEIIYRNSDFPSSYQLFQKVLEDLLLLSPNSYFDVIVKKRKIQRKEEFVDVKKIMNSTPYRNNNTQCNQRRKNVQKESLISKIEEN